MKTCHECGAPQLEGSLFCTECGVEMAYQKGATSGNLTTALPFKQFTSPKLSPPVVDGQTLLKTVQKKLVFMIPSSRRRVILTLQEQLYIGRANPEAELYPDLDLAGDGGEDAGVSRVHAVIQMTADGVVLRDLNSTNGTLLNNYLLDPEMAYLLSNGSEIQFGELLVHIFFD